MKPRCVECLSASAEFVADDCRSIAAAATRMSAFVRCIRRCAIVSVPERPVPRKHPQALLPWLRIDERDRRLRRGADGRIRARRYTDRHVARRAHGRLAVQRRCRSCPAGAAGGLLRLRSRATSWASAWCARCATRASTLRRSSRVDAPTTLCLVGLDADGVPNYAFYGDGGADRQLGTDALSRVPPSAAAVHVGSFARSSSRSHRPCARSSSGPRATGC